MSAGEWLLISLVAGVVGALIGGFLLGVAFTWGTRAAGGIAVRQDPLSEPANRRPSQTSRQSKRLSVTSEHRPSGSTSTVVDDVDDDALAASAKTSGVNQTEVESIVKESSTRIAQLLAEADTGDDRNDKRR